MEHESDYSTASTSRSEGKEYTLHRIMAGSAFVFALCILPIAQYLLTQSQKSEEPVAESASASPRYGYDQSVGDQNGQGEVAGVSTDNGDTSVLSNIPADATVSPEPKDRAECLAWKERDLSDLKTFSEGKHASMQSDYEKEVEPAGVALAALKGDSVEVNQKRDEQNATINAVTDTYLNELSQVEAAVTKRQQEIEDRTCPTE